MSHFACEGITRLYDGAAVVQDITLSLEKGELSCLLGPSGGGKTTLMNILAGVDQPDAGRVLLQGREITGQPGQVSYMLQKDLLLPYKTVLDNVSLPLQLGGTPRRAAWEQAAAQLERFALSGCGHKYPQQLSGGMRQRAALLRTWLTGKDVMLLDEPFSALDAITKRDMHSWYLEIAASLGATTLLITHDIDEALLLADRVHILSGTPGRLTMTMQVQPARPRSADFVTSEVFLRQKRELLRAIDA